MTGLQGLNDQNDGTSTSFGAEGNDSFFDHSYDRYLSCENEVKEWRVRKCISENELQRRCQGECVRENVLGRMCEEMC